MLLAGAGTLPLAAGAERSAADRCGCGDAERYYRRLIFDNSRAPDVYFYSRGAFTGGSWLELDNGRLPVEGAVFFSPPNALRLRWRSRPRGIWDASLLVENWRNRNPVLPGSELRFWLWTPAPLARLPLLQANDDQGGFSAPLAFATTLPVRQWRQFAIPLRSFRSVSLRPFQPQRLHSLTFLQNDADDQDHTLILDDVMVGDPPRAVAPPPPAPHGLEAAAQDSHIDLHWQPPPGAAIERYVIHRSEDNRNFQPIGVQAPAPCRYADFSGNDRRRFFYRVTAEDGGRQSLPSPVAAAATRAFSDDELLTMVQEACFRYYWEGAHPVSGLARESLPGDEALVATGASGFGIMALLVGAARGFITRAQCLARMGRIVRFLAAADRFHGAWAHFMDGATGKALPVFGKYDNGADLVETAFLMQGLLTARQFFAGAGEEEALRRAVTRLWHEVEWDWFRNPADSDFLVWHWSPDYGFHINHPLIGFNETLIAYLLAIASPTHPIPPRMYYDGWASPSRRAQDYRRGWGRTSEGDRYSNGGTYYGVRLDAGVGPGGPLFFTHYSFLGFDPRGLRDAFTDYWRNNRAIAEINLRYCIANPGRYLGYGADCWGLTASDGPGGYKAHEPVAWADDGTITPTGALASMPYLPEAAMAALKHFYRRLGDRMWGSYGFYDAMNLGQNWFARIYMGLNQAPITVMIENHRSGRPWQWFMANPEIRPALARIGFRSDSAPGSGRRALS